MVDITKQGYGSTNDGNTERRFFANTEVVAKVFEIDESLIKRLANSTSFQKTEMQKKNLTKN